ncbi:hypothetical protein CWI84_07555 [Idiomarina tyrosinivorans]|uniref:CdsD C-terminal domain-containing protein n=1 Tax=Idiomarina tyrosinivorans TaxID=1445662 RepID=A0A432ZQF9_9GAMM|nr:hypothetical protein [Idiomarina tyrosinivorans]RUO80144.1 hypothetical protein CWI84_07555 [Idiomarina tyrosinivorans]
MKYCLSGLLTIGVALSVNAQDPTQPYGWNQQQQSLAVPVTLKVSAIRVGNHSATAVINGRSVEQGDQIEGYTVIEIMPSYVLVSDQSQQHRLTVFNAGNVSIKRSSEQGER